MGHYKESTSQDQARGVLWRVSKTVRLLRTWCSCLWRGGHFTGLGAIAQAPLLDQDSGS